MRFINCQASGGPEVMLIAEMPSPQPQEKQVVIQVHACGVNRPDLAQRKGQYPAPPGASGVLGLEVAGVVSATGKGSKWKIGDRVCALVNGGGYAEFVAAPDGQCLPWPAQFSALEAAALPENYFTVWYNVFMIGQLKPKEKFLVHGGSSGIGTTAIQLARAFGAEVFTTAGSDDKCRKCAQLGADHVINYRQLVFDDEIKRLTSGQGVDLILDMVGGDYTAKNIECLGAQGRLVQIATQKGRESTIDMATVMIKRLKLTGSTLRPRTAVEKSQIASQLLEHVWPLFANRQVGPIIHQVFPFDQVRDAHQRLEEGNHFGKIMLELQPS